MSLKMLYIWLCTELLNIEYTDENLKKCKKNNPFFLKTEQGRAGKFFLKSIW